MGALVCQTPGYEKQERGRFFGGISGKGKATLVGFCVLEGFFLEGVDLTGEKSDRGSDRRNRTSQIGSQREILK